MNKSKILSRNKAFQSKYFYIDKVEIKGQSNTYTKDIIVRCDVVLIIPVTNTNEIYLVAEYRDAYEKTLLEVIGGTMDDGGTPLEDAKRELKEETGIIAKRWQQIATWDLSANIIGKINVFLAQDLELGIATPDDDEQISLVKLSLDDAIEKITHGEITVAHNIASLYLVHGLLHKNEL